MVNVTRLGSYGIFWVTRVPRLGLIATSSRIPPHSQSGATEDTVECSDWVVARRERRTAGRKQANMKSVSENGVDCM